MKVSKKFTVNLPKDIKIVYYKNDNFLLIMGPLGQKSLKLKFKLLLTDSLIYITKIKSDNFLVTQKKILSSFRGTLFSSIKQIILEVSILLWKKVKLVGIGYKIFPVTINSYQLLQLKLGFSHSIFYKVPANFEITILKSTFLYVTSNSFYSTNQFVAEIQSFKKPDAYKGKGVLKDNENIKLKEGKKI